MQHCFANMILNKDAFFSFSSKFLWFIQGSFDSLAMFSTALSDWKSPIKCLNVVGGQKFITSKFEGKNKKTPGRS